MRSLLLVLTYLHLSAANASGYFTGPISSAMGGTGRAGINSAEGSFLNPATIPLIKNYEAIAYYRDGYIGERQHRQTLALGAADNSEGVLFPGALHYLRTRDTGRSGDPANGEIWHASGAYLITDRLSVGATVFHSVYGIDGRPEYKQWGASLGAIVLIHDELSFAYVLENIGKPGSDMPVALREDLTHAIGSFWRFATLATLRFDVTRMQNDDLNPDGKMTYMAGVESAFSEFGVFRVGFRREELTDLKIWTAGMGFNGPRLRFDYAMEKNEEGTSGALHSVDMRIPF